MPIIQVPTNPEYVRVLHISQLFKEHITDLMISLSRKAAEKGFSENVFDIFGYVDSRDVAYLRLEPRPIEEQIDLGARSILQGIYTLPYREVTPELLRAFDAGHLCVAKRDEMELLVNAPGDMPQYQRFLIVLEAWKQLNKEIH
ncbi:hypothetical protein [Burkholderia phage FLC9]|nr:hypothetical protein [Burkholderia phage FLC9]